MISDQLNDINIIVQKEFAPLSDSMLNTAPAEGKWSISECLDHLVVSNETYFAAFDSVLSGKYMPGWWGRMNPFSNFIGKKGLQIISSDTAKLKSPKIFAPGKPGDIQNIAVKFANHQQRLKVYFDRLENRKLLNEVISSPVAAAITFKIGDVLEILAEHERRHIKQAIHAKQLLNRKK